MGWSDEDLKLSAKLFADGLSFSQIRPRLGATYSRSAVGASLNRRGLCRGGVPQPAQFRRPRTPRIARVAIQRNAPAPLAAAVFEPAPADQDIPLAQRCSLLELNSDRCHWPIGEPGTPEFFFCGAVAVSVYCPGHHVIAHDRVRGPSAKQYYRPPFGG